MDLARRRLYSQHLSQSPFEKPDDVVAWFGAVQAQDYTGALWAVGLRMRNATERDVEQALAKRRIVRTWPMRGTLHFVAAADVRWMRALLAPRVVAATAWRLQGLGLDDGLIGRCRDLWTDALQGGKTLTRKAMYRVLDSAGISTADGRGLQVLGRLAQEGLICFGPRDGKQQTFVLLDEWVAPTRVWDRDEALAELARRYFTGHGPATVQDLAWWSGLTISDAAAGREMAGADLEGEEAGGRTYWSSARHAPPAGTENGALPSAHLLPAYDEYMVGYTDRSAALERLGSSRAIPPTVQLGPTIAVDGQIVGSWKRTLEKNHVTIASSLFAELTGAEQEAQDRAAQRYASFLELSSILT